MVVESVPLHLDAFSFTRISDVVMICLFNSAYRKIAHLQLLSRYLLND